MKKLLTEKKKKSILVYLILWLLLAIVFVLPLSTVYTDSLDNKGQVNITSFKENVGPYILNIQTRFKAFKQTHISNTKKVLGYYTFIYAGVMIILFLKSKDDGDYHDIEHGSSDWCEGGEQYTVLSKTSGLVLAQKNYLPVDKPGNVNVLIVGRIWCW